MKDILCFRSGKLTYSGWSNPLTSEMSSEWKTVQPRGRAKRLRSGGDLRSGPQRTGGGGHQRTEGGNVPHATALGSTRSRSTETGVKLIERPNIVVLDCKEFSVLCPGEELAQFLFKVVLAEEENRHLFREIKSVYPDDKKKQYLLEMSTEQSMNEMVKLLSDGVKWVGYRNEEANRDIIVTGYSMENPIINIILSKVAFWNNESSIREVVSTWGDVIELKVAIYTFNKKSLLWN